MKEIEGDLIELAKAGKFHMIVHGANCFCTMGSGIAKQIKENFPWAFYADAQTAKGDITKLGNYTKAVITRNNINFIVVNAYTQYGYGTDFPKIDYEALALCLRKLNHNYKGLRIGLPRIGAGLAGGDWERIREIISKELTDVEAVIVNYKNKNR